MTTMTRTPRRQAKPALVVAVRANPAVDPAAAARVLQVGLAAALAAPQAAAAVPRRWVGAKAAPVAAKAVPLVVSQGALAAKYPAAAQALAAKYPAAARALAVLAAKARPALVGSRMIAGSS
jgi:hypothetical protein